MHIPRFDHGQQALQPGALQALGRLAPINDDFGQGNRAYGLRFGSTLATMDDAQQNEVWEGWEQQRPPGMDTVQEFGVETNGASAKYSRPTSIIMSSKGGTNEIHGSVFEFARNSGIGVARTREEYFTKPAFLNRHEYGAPVGGPVFIPRVYNGKNRSFFFFAWKARNSNSPVTSSWRVPTAAMRNGDFSGLRDSRGRLITLYDPWTTNTATNKQEIGQLGCHFRAAAFILEREKGRNNEEAQAWKEQPRGFGARTRLHGHELRLWPGQR